MESKHYSKILFFIVLVPLHLPFPIYLTFSQINLKSFFNPFYLEAEGVNTFFPYFRCAALHLVRTYKIFHTFKAYVFTLLILTYFFQSGSLQSGKVKRFIFTTDPFLYIVSLYQSFQQAIRLLIGIFIITQFWSSVFLWIQP